ncbi:MAG: nucleotidyltransferase, partial [Candidatus Electrothrix sp. AW2]|nr:nucleotidyltransferase [Candidatus Electrothrix gigas]
VFGLVVIKSRNRTSHTYNEETANEISRTIISLYYNAFQKMNDRLDIFKNDDQ